MASTGNFALALMVDSPVNAPVLSQPSLPFAISKSRRRDVAISDADLEKVKVKCAAEDLTVLGLRFTGDRLVPAERFQRLRDGGGRPVRCAGRDRLVEGQPAWQPDDGTLRVLTEQALLGREAPAARTASRCALEMVLDLYHTPPQLSSFPGEARRVDSSPNAAGKRNCRAWTHEAR